MIKLEHTVLMNFDQMNFVIEGMRNAMNSWNKSDTKITGDVSSNTQFMLGENDFDLMNRLSIAGSEHRKYMRMMPVWVRITAPLYWWKEFDTYKVGTVANSCSTMHKIHARPFDISDFSVDHLISFGAADRGPDEPAWQLNYDSPGLMHTIVNALNNHRERYLKRKDKEVWWQMIQLLPSSYNQTRNVMLNYEVLANIYRQRKNHKLDEWIAFCEWIKSLPYAELIIGERIK